MGQRICGWCKKPMGEKEGVDQTDGICPECLKKQNELLEEMIKNQGDQNESDD